MPQPQDATASNPCSKGIPSSAAHPGARVPCSFPPAVCWLLLLTRAPSHTSTTVFVAPDPPQFLVHHVTMFYLRAVAGLARVAAGRVPPSPPLMRVAPTPRTPAVTAAPGSGDKQSTLRGSQLWLEHGSALGDVLSPLAGEGGVFCSAVDPVLGLTLLQWLAVFRANGVKVLAPPASAAAAAAAVASAASDTDTAQFDTPMAIVVAPPAAGTPQSSADADASSPATPTTASGTAPVPVPPQPVTVRDLYRVCDWMLGVTLVMRLVWVRAAAAFDDHWGGTPPAKPLPDRGVLTTVTESSAPLATRIARWAHGVSTPSPCPRFTLCGVSCIGSTSDTASPAGARRSLSASCAVFLRAEAVLDAAGGTRDDASGGGSSHAVPSLLHAAMAAAAPDVLGLLAAAVGPSESDPPLPPSALFGRQVLPSRLTVIVVSVPTPTSPRRESLAVLCLPSAAGASFWGKGRAAGNVEEYYKQLEVQLYQQGKDAVCAAPGCAKVAGMSGVKAEDDKPLSFQRCGRCRFVLYCSRDCQVGVGGVFVVVKPHPAFCCLTSLDNVFSAVPQAKAWKSGHKKRCKQLASAFVNVKKLRELDWRAHLGWIGVEHVR